MSELPDFRPCASCELPGACRAARRCAHRQEEDDMAATVTAHIWLKLAAHTDERRALSRGEVRTLCAQYGFREQHLEQMVASGRLRSTGRPGESRYYVDRACAVPNQLTMGEVQEALARRDANLRQHKEKRT